MLPLPSRDADLSQSLPLRDGRRSSIGLIARLHSDHNLRVTYATAMHRARVAFHGEHDVPADDAAAIIGGHESAVEEADIVVSADPDPPASADQIVVDGSGPRALHDNYHHVMRPAALRDAIERAAAHVSRTPSRTLGSSGAGCGPQRGRRSGARCPAGTSVPALDVATERLAAALATRARRRP